MTKAEIISFVKNNLGSIDKTNKYHDVVVEKAITVVFNQAYGDIYDNDPRLLDNYTKTFGGDGTPIAITENTNTGIYEATLPSIYVPFNDKHSGVRHVATPTVSTFKFFPVAKREFENLSNTLTGELNAGDPIGFYVVRGGTLEFFGVDSAQAAIGCRIDMVIPFDQYADDDEVIIPFAKDKDLLQFAVEAFRTAIKVDLRDNNADTE